MVYAELGAAMPGAGGAYLWRTSTSAKRLVRVARPSCCLLADYVLQWVYVFFGGQQESRTMSCVSSNTGEATPGRPSM